MAKVFKVYLSGTVGTEERYKKEDVFQKLVEAAEAAKVDGLTLIDTLGIYKGEPEIAYIAEIAYSTTEKVIKLAEMVRAKLEQETVLVYDGNQMLEITE